MFLDVHFPNRDPISKRNVAKNCVPGIVVVLLVLCGVRSAELRFAAAAAVAAIVAAGSSAAKDGQCEKVRTSKVAYLGLCSTLLQYYIDEVKLWEGVRLCQQTE